jgi:hypothetical protein
MPMVPFFRKIRHRLLNEKRLTRYLLYAIGEILLVAIGILLAIQADNWYERRQRFDRETVYLKGLFGDLTDDKTYLENRIEELHSAVDSQLEYLTRSYEQQESLEEVKELFSLHNLATDHLSLRTTTYMELLNSGNLNIIQNEGLKKGVIDYYNEGQELSLEISEYNNVSTAYMTEANRVVKNIIKFYNQNHSIFDSPDMYTAGEWAFINDPWSDEFLSIQSMVWFYRIRNQQYISYYTTLDTMAEELLQQIGEELARR